MDDLSGILRNDSRYSATAECEICGGDHSISDCPDLPDGPRTPPAPRILTGDPWEEPTSPDFWSEVTEVEPSEADAREEVSRPFDLLDREGRLILEIAACDGYSAPDHLIREIKGWLAERGLRMIEQDTQLPAGTFYFRPEEEIGWVGSTVPSSPPVVAYRGCRIMAVQRWRSHGWRTAG